MNVSNKPRLFNASWSQVNRSGENSTELQSISEPLEGSLPERPNELIMSDKHAVNRRASRIERRIRRAAGGSRGNHPKITDDSNNEDEDDVDEVNNDTFSELDGNETFPAKRIRRRVIRARDAKPCSYCHVPYHHRLAPFSNMKLVPCLLCGKKWVSLYICR